MESMIAPQQNDRILAQGKTVQFIQQSSYKRIDIASAGIVAVAQFRHLYLRDRSPFGDIAVTFQFEPAAHR